MKKFLGLLLFSVLLSSGLVKAQYDIKNRYYPVDMDESIDGVWSAENGTDIADSIYLQHAGLPDYGDLIAPDLELKMKALWYGSKMYFLFRHMDDSLVNGKLSDGSVDETVKPSINHFDATTLYLYLESSDARRYIDTPMYTNNTHLDSIASISWVWGTDSIIGVIRNDSVWTLEEFEGADLIQWEEGGYRYAKVSLDMNVLAPEYVTNNYIVNYEKTPYDTIPGPNINIDASFGFEVHLNENDKERENNGLFEVQTRAYYSADMDSLPTAPRNVIKWGTLEMSFGSYCAECEESSFLKTVNSSFAAIYPNPAQDYLFIEFGNYIAADYRIVDLMGRVVKRGKANGYDSVVRVDDLKAGTYFVNLVNTKGEMMTEKLLINR